MAGSFTTVETRTFTLTHAKYIASKIAADLRRLNRLYGKPGLENIEDYEKEAIAYLREGYLERVFYGFKKDGAWIEPTLKYESKDLENILFDYTDDDPGKIRPGANIAGARFYSYLVHTEEFERLDPSTKSDFQENVPISRTGADEPVEDGFFQGDLKYSAGSRALDRSSLRSYR